MKKKLFFYFLIICVTGIVSMGLLSAKVAPHVIAFFIRPATSALSPEVAKKELEDPARILGYHAKYPSAGIMVLYAGRASISNPFGQVVFGRWQTEPKLNVLVTIGLEPLPVSPFTEATIWGFALDPEKSAELYSFERKKDSETGLDAWFVEKKERPQWREIPYKTIIVFADPDEVVVPTGMFITKAEENFLLPDIYVTSSVSPVYNVLKFSKLRNYFTPIKKEFRLKDAIIEERLTSG